jgi:pimeloyl-ACP methyl ester carboxylesterase
MVSTHELTLRGGRLLVAYDAPVAATDAHLTVIWHHGSPHTGVPLPPLLDLAANRGIRLVTYARPSYGDSSAQPGRSVASAAADVEQLADALGLGRFATMGASGGGPHAIACAALLPDRVIASATMASPAPWTDETDWFAGMAAPGALQAATRGRDARARDAETETFDENQFIGADWAALAGTWAALGQDAQRAEQQGPGGLIDDDVAFAKPWGADLTAIASPVLLVQGGLDRVIPAHHADLLLHQIPTAELWLRPRDGHISVLGAAGVVMDWLLASASA